jgi:hypothetical protein
MVEKITGQQSRLTPNLFYPDMTKEDLVPRRLDGDIQKAFAAGGRLAQTGNLYVDDTRDNAGTHRRSHVASNANAALSAWCWWTT